MVSGMRFSWLRCFTLIADEVPVPLRDGLIRSAVADQAETALFKLVLANQRLRGFNQLGVDVGSVQRRCG